MHSIGDIVNRSSPCALVPYWKEAPSVVEVVCIGYVASLGGSL